MTELVGILNITPDSFSDGGLFEGVEAATGQADRLFKDGAALVDIGAESTRPGARALTPAEEWYRLGPVLEALYKKYPGKLSVDTYHPETVAMALQVGDVIINDVTGTNNPAMIEVISRHKARCIISHLPGADIQAAHRGEPVTSMQTVIADLKQRAELLKSKGLPPENIILDPGIGFGKTKELNRQLLEVAQYLPTHKVMIGYSRKRFLGDRRMDIEPNLEAGRVAIASGAAYLRVHDVAAHAAILEAHV